jgi:DNA-binding transcriptional ArsR family regulator
MLLVKKQRNETLSIPCKELTATSIKAATSPLAQRILKSLAENPAYPRQLARQLKVHEQKVYYHIRKLEQADIIQPAHQATRQGVVAQYFTLTEPSFAVRFKQFQQTAQKETFANESSFLEPFIQNGELKALIIVGSPDPHGPEKARSRDGFYGMDLALFLGTFLNYIPGLNVRLDTEVRQDDLKNNLIIIGGPIVNTVTDKINSKLPIRFTGKSIYSTISDNEYFSDETGIIVKSKNHFDKTKKILLVAGNRHAGTRACMIAFMKRFKDISAGNKHNQKIEAKVIEGIDLDSDGIVDDVEVKE